jgi:hypothetical protein
VRTAPERRPAAEMRRVASSIHRSRTAESISAL